MTGDKIFALRLKLVLRWDSFPEWTNERTNERMDEALFNHEQFISYLLKQ